MRKSLLVTLGLVFLVTISVAFTADKERRYKNLKVLPKDITKNEMDTIMKHFTVALGVKCNFCHTFNTEAKAMDFASDANKHKDMARNMMRMTKKINKKYFEFTSYGDIATSLTVSCA
ncbi:MAG: c-type cytochrome, partial [Chitinophagaceae bacterium]